MRWTPVDGATAYEVLYPDLVPAVSFQTTTNVADEREFFTFHSALGYTTIHWRVRAIRDIGQFQSSTNGLPAVSYGPWSPIYTTVNAPQTPATLKPTDTISDTWDKAGKARDRAPADPRIRLVAVGTRDLGGHRPRLEPLPRLHLLRPELRQPDLHRLDRRLAGVGAPDRRRPDAAAR